MTPLSSSSTSAPPAPADAAPTTTGLVCLRNRSRHTVVAVGLTRAVAENLAAQIRRVLSDTPTNDLHSEGAAMR